jgi:hypothetical protein
VLVVGHQKYSKYRKYIKWVVFVFKFTPLGLSAYDPFYIDNIENIDTYYIVGSANQQQKNDTVVKVLHVKFVYKLEPLIMLVMLLWLFDNITQLHFPPMPRTVA